MNDLCPIGRRLQDKAAACDRVFKTQVLAFFSHSNKSRSEDEMLEIERLGIYHRGADEDFHRHQQLCDKCSEAMTAHVRLEAAPAPLSPLD
jgi:hypothetical protein